MKAASANLSWCLMQTPKSLNLWPKMPDLGTFVLKVENQFVIFEISTLEGV